MDDEAIDRWDAPALSRVEVEAIEAEYIARFFD